ncbi:MAG: glycosyltransferase [Bacteroidales bacterium]|nr:glycosyltransferase [Bacteroidales bacterium]
MLKISVVTVSFNAGDCIEKTILSVLGQSYSGIEYIIIDGGSTDSTMEITGRYRDRIALILSERDRGIYDGMNKGILAATGDFLLFMNADDVFSDSEVVADVAKFIESHPEAEAIFGNSAEVREYGTFINRPDTAFFNHKMAVCHQATFVRTAILRKHPFDLRYKYAADFEQLSSLFLEGINFVHFDRLIATCVLSTGTTFRHQIESANELYDIIESRGIDCKTERKKIIRHKKMVLAFRTWLPGFITRPVFRFLAKHYKAL